VLYCFAIFSPLGYGTVQTRDQCLRLKWNRNWNFECPNDEPSKSVPTTGIESEDNSEDSPSLETLSPEVA
jgi:hypothetical protein